VYTHVVLFKLKDPANVAQAIGLFESMRGKVPILKDIDVQADDVHSDYSADLCIVCRFDRAEDVDVYMKDPFHQGILAQTAPLVASKMKIDFWGRR
jgi:hypothetical protein